MGYKPRRPQLEDQKVPLFPVTMKFWILLAIFTLAFMVQNTWTAALPSDQNTQTSTECSDLKGCSISAAGAENPCPHVGPPGRNFCLWNERLRTCKHRFTRKECGK